MKLNYIGSLNRIYKMIEVYTDGSCLKNSGGSPGGWAFIMIINDINWSYSTEYHVSGNNSNTTNNRMELQAVIEALSFVIEEVIDVRSKYRIYTDSKLTLHCAKREWKRNANLDLWEIYDAVSKDKEIEWIWVKAHNGNNYNEMVDKLARDSAKSI